MKKYPFKFLDAYGKNDSGIFFGRDDEATALYQMVFQTNILLVYGPSGSGKTSLIRCGLASKFEAHDWFELYVRRGDNFNNSLDTILREEIGESQSGKDLSWLEEFDELGQVAGAGELNGTARQIRNLYLKNFRPVYLIFDQFEEIFILGDKTEWDLFASTIKQVLEIDIPVKVIFSIREEYLAYLYELEKDLPRLLKKRLRVEPMNLPKLKEVINGVTNSEKSIVTIEPRTAVDGFATELFQKIKEKENSATIQLTYLQVFLDKLYLKVAADGERKRETTFTVQALKDMGDIDDVLRDFLEEQVKFICDNLSKQGHVIAPEMVWKVLSPFATEEGTKKPMARTEVLNSLKEAAGITEDEISKVIEWGVERRVLRLTDDNKMYEVAHDSLAKCIAAQRSVEERALLEINRWIKDLLSNKKEVRGVLTEQQLNIIKPLEGKLKINDDGRQLLDDSRKKLNSQKRTALFQSALPVIAVVCIFLLASTVFAFYQRGLALKSEHLAQFNLNSANTYSIKLQAALADVRKEQTISRAKDVERFGDNFYELGDYKLALSRYTRAIDTLSNFPSDTNYSRINKKIEKCSKKL